MARVPRLENRWRTVYLMNDSEGQASEDFAHGVAFYSRRSPNVTLAFWKRDTTGA